MTNFDKNEKNILTASIENSLSDAMDDNSIFDLSEINTHDCQYLASSSKLKENDSKVFIYPLNVQNKTFFIYQKIS